MKHLTKLSFNKIILCSFLTACISLNSCEKKVKIEYITLDSLNKADLIGDYHFLYGQTSGIQYITPENLEYQLGFRVSSEKITFFKDGDLACECKFMNSPYIAIVDSDNVLYECETDERIWVGYFKDVGNNRLKTHLEFEENRAPTDEETYPAYYFQKD